MLRRPNWVIHSLLASILLFSVLSPSQPASSTTLPQASLPLAGSIEYFPVIKKVDIGPTVHLTASASGGGTLSYQWRTTDGLLVNTNGSQADWQLPAGPGFHFAYVLVTDNQGGMTEGRLAVNTDTIGSPLSPPPGGTTPLAPPAPSQAVNYWRGWVQTDLQQISDPSGTVTTNILLPGIYVRLRGLAFGDVTPTALSDSKGQVLIKGGMTTELYDVECSLDNVFFSKCGGGSPRPYAASVGLSETAEMPASGVFGSAPVWGRLTLADGVTPCGGSDPFFGMSIVPQATLIDPNQVTNSTTFNDYGFFFGAGPSHPIFTVRFQCQSAFTESSPPGSGDGSASLSGTARPAVSGMTAILNNTPVGIFLPPPTGPSDIVPRSDNFLSFKGLDSRLGACLYYKAIGVVADCATDGTLQGGTTFDQWKRAVGLAPYATAGGTEVEATYVNKVDLNLTRVHHSITYGPDHTAAYVCNHLGPTNETQAEVDRVVDNAIAGKNLVACVAMDFLVHPGANNDQPFVRFMIFGPDGELLPSINLDGRGEKFMPGACVACHGGDAYANAFPTDGSGQANIGGHFLPYDTGNFAFSSKAGLTEADQQHAIHLLNEYVLATNPTSAVLNLVQNWYSSGTDVLDKNYVPSGWQGTAVNIAFYKTVVARACRTCHVAMADFNNFDTGTFGAPGPIISTFCSPGLSVRAYRMPNSLVTFNRFWNSAGTAEDQVAATNAYMAELGYSSSCTLSAPALH